MNRVTASWTVGLLIALLSLSTTSLFGEERLSYLPMTGYEMVSLHSLDLQGASVGGAILGKEATFVGLYSYRFFDQEPAPSYPDYYHALDLLYDGRPGRHQIVGLLKTESDEPIYGGMETFQSAVVYGYEVISRPDTTLALGGGIAAADFGLDLPLLPVPFLRLAHESPWLDADFDFITGPNLGFILRPESHFQLRGDGRMDQFRDIRDLVFELTLHYRFFSEGTARDSFAGVAFGVKNDVLGYVVGSSGDEQELQYRALFAEVDLGILKVAGGYAFDGRQRLGDDRIDTVGDGFLVTIEGIYMFGGEDR